MERKNESCCSVSHTVTEYPELHCLFFFLARLDHQGYQGLLRTENRKTTMFESGCTVAETREVMHCIFMRWWIIS